MDARRTAAILLVQWVLVTPGLGRAERLAPTNESAPRFTVESSNFVVTAPSAPLARAVLAAAEQNRARLAREWLGEELPPSVGPTVIRVRLSETADQGLSWVADSQDRLSHLVWLTTSAERAVGTTLAHEMAHVVLATEYPGALPAWANEAIACREDDPARCARREKVIAWYARSGNWPSLGKLLSAASLAPTDEASYAVAESLATYLLRHGPRQRFLAFALDGGQHGWDLAASRHYGVRNLAELEAAWRQWVVQP